MDYKTIVVHLDAQPRRVARLEIALRLAAQCGSHLVGLFAINAIPMPRYAGAEWSSALVEAGEQQLNAARTEARAAFETTVRQYPEVSSEWREDSAGPLDAVMLSARYADLVVAGQHDSDAKIDSRVTARFVEELILKLSKPLLMVPYIGKFDILGERVLLAWDASPQAMRAVTGALPLLKRAKKVQVTVFDARIGQDAHGEEPGADITLFLARHGVNATVSRQGSLVGDVGSAILSRAADLSADLIVMGTYGHSRTKERLLGGATRTIFDSMTMPVLMCH